MRQKPSGRTTRAANQVETLEWTPKLVELRAENDSRQQQVHANCTSEEEVNVRQGAEEDGFNEESQSGTQQPPARQHNRLLRALQTRRHEKEKQEMPDLALGGHSPSAEHEPPRELGSNP